MVLAGGEGAAAMGWNPSRAVGEGADPLAALVVCWVPERLAGLANASPGD